MWRVAILAMWGAFACAEPVDVRDADAGPSLLPVGPAAPAAPVLGECDEASTVAHPRGPSTCQPWAVGRRPSCARGEIASGGECVPLGRACGAAPRSSEGAVLYVDPVAPEGGDGSEASPVRSIAEALAVRAADVTLRLSPGVHVGGVDLGEGVALEGACVAQTTVVSSADPARLSTLAVEGQGVSIRDLRIEGPRIGVLARAGSSLTVEGVHVDGAEMYGLACLACELHARDLWVRDVQGREMPGTSVTAGYGMTLEAALVTLEHVVVERTNELGVLFAASTIASVDDLILLDIATGPSGQMGIGIAVSIAAELDARGVIIEGVPRAGVVVERQALATLRNVFARDIAGLPTRRPAGAVLEVSGEGEALVEGLTAIDVVAGVSVARGVVTLRDARFDQLHGVAPYGVFGHVLRAIDGATLVAERIHAEDVSDVGVVALEGSRLELSDARVLGVRGAFDPDGTLDQASGLGALARSGAELSLTRAELADTTLVAAAASGPPGTLLRLEDVFIHDVAPGPFPELGGGRALLSIVAARIDALRVRVERARELAVSAWFGGALHAQELAVVETLERGDGRGGIAIGAYGGGHLELDRFLVSTAALCGVQLAFGAAEPDPSAPANDEGGTAVLSHGRIEQAPLGLNVQVPDTDLIALLATLTFHEVDRRVTADALPVPRPETSELVDP